ncbi:MAG: hypothetical protein WA821_19685 [Anaerolineales bacterium]
MQTVSKAEKILKELRFDFASFSMESFLRYIGESRGRKIVCIPWEREMPFDVFGAWVVDAEHPIVYIFYRASLHPIHQTHVVLHELAHYLCDHPTLRVTEELLNRIAAQQASLPFSDLPQLRSNSKAQMEAEAETLADLIQKRILRHDHVERLAQGAVPQEKLADFLKTLGAK